MRNGMTPWELRGYLTWPRTDGKPHPGTREEMNWSIGWNRAQREDNIAKQSQLGMDLQFDMDLGRESFAAHYGTK